MFNTAQRISRRRDQQQLHVAGGEPASARLCGCAHSDGIQVDASGTAHSRFRDQRQLVLDGRPGAINIRRQQRLRHLQRPRQQQHRGPSGSRHQRRHFDGPALDCGHIASGSSRTTQSRRTSPTTRPSGSAPLSMAMDRSSPTSTTTQCRRRHYSFEYGIRGGARGWHRHRGPDRQTTILPFGEAAGVWFFAGNGIRRNRTTLNLTQQQHRWRPNFVRRLLPRQYTGTTFQITGLACGNGTNATQVAAFIASTDDDAGAVVDAGTRQRSSINVEGRTEPPRRCSPRTGGVDAHAPGRQSRRDTIRARRFATVRQLTPPPPTTHRLAVTRSKPIRAPETGAGTRRSPRSAHPVIVDDGVLTPGRTRLLRRRRDRALERGRADARSSSTRWRR